MGRQRRNLRMYRNRWQYNWSKAKLSLNACDQGHRCRVFRIFEIVNAPTVLSCSTLSYFTKLSPLFPFLFTHHHRLNDTIASYAKIRHSWSQCPNTFLHLELWSHPLLIYALQFLRPHGAVYCLALHKSDTGSSCYGGTAGHTNYCCF